MDDLKGKDIYLRKDNQIIGLHAVGYEGPYEYVLVKLDGTRKTIQSDFEEIESWGNEYNQDFEMIGKGSFRIFDISIDDTAKALEEDGWERFDRPNLDKDNVHSNT